MKRIYLLIAILGLGAAQVQAQDVNGLKNNAKEAAEEMQQTGEKEVNAKKQEALDAKEVRKANKIVDNEAKKAEMKMKKASEQVEEASEEVKETKEDMKHHGHTHGKGHEHSNGKHKGHSHEDGAHVDGHVRGVADKPRMSKEERIKMHKMRAEKMAQRQDQMSERLAKAEAMMKQKLESGEINEEQYKEKMSRLAAAREKMKALAAKAKANEGRFNTTAK